MPLTLVLLWICYGIVATSADVSEEELFDSRFLSSPEENRSVFQLGHMIRCQTGCDPLMYKRYGCFCGFKGAGRPVDSIDSCCWDHDWCYARLGCPPFMLYVLRYAWICKRTGQAQCIEGNYVNPVANQCAHKLCECDRLFAKCVAKFSCPQRRAICWSNPFIAFTNIISSLH